MLPRLPHGLQLGSHAVSANMQYVIRAAFHQGHGLHLYDSGQVDLLLKLLHFPDLSQNRMHQRLTRAGLLPRRGCCSEHSQNESLDDGMPVCLPCCAVL